MRRARPPGCPWVRNMTFGYASVIRTRSEGRRHVRKSTSPCSLPSVRIRRILRRSPPSPMWAHMNSMNFTPFRRTSNRRGDASVPELPDSARRMLALPTARSALSSATGAFRPAPSCRRPEGNTASARRAPCGSRRFPSPLLVRGTRLRRPCSLANPDERLAVAGEGRKRRGGSVPGVDTATVVASRGQLSALLCPRPRRHHRQTGRAARLKAAEATATEPGNHAVHPRSAMDPTPRRRCRAHCAAGGRAGVPGRHPGLCVRRGIRPRDGVRRTPRPRRSPGPRRSRGRAATSRRTSPWRRGCRPRDRPTRRSAA